jgi:hypothetical protein
MAVGAGAGTIKVERRMGLLRPLRPGRYRFTIVPVDVAGNRGAARSIRFTVTK